MVLALVGIVVARALARLVTDGWWFEALHHSDVLSTISRARLELGLVGGVAAAAVLHLCLLLVDRTPPLERPYGTDDQLVTRYQVLVAEHGLALRLGVSAAFGLVAGLPLAGRWQEWLLFRHAVMFHQSDGVYGHDISFYVFRLPFLMFALEWVFSVLLVITLLTTVTHYLSGSVRLAGPRRSSPGVRLHVSVLLIALALVRAAAYWLHRYELVTSTRGYVRGLGATDEHHVRPALALLALVAITTAVLLVVGLRLRSWRLPIVAASLWAVVALVAGTVYPAVVQRVRSHDEPALRERPAIQRNLVATRTAFGLDGVSASTESLQGTSASVDADELASLADVRLLSSAVAARTMSLPSSNGQPAPAAGSRPDVGLYQVDGEARQVFVGVPAIDPGDRVSWDDRHRHAVTAAKPLLVEASVVTADGASVTVPDAGALAVRAGPIYVGEDAGSFAVVSKVGTPPAPDALTAVPLSSFARRAAFALRFADLELLQRVDTSDRILYVRSVADRVRTLAPFLRWDSEPYAVVASGRLVWVVDGYTTADGYPSAERADVSGVAQGSGLQREFNYVRNSVKAIVDAHDGNVTLYAVDTSDPVLEAWRGAFPSLFEDWSQLLPAVKAQLHYPADLMRVQAAMWGRYRTDDARSSDAALFTTLTGRWTTAPTRVVGTGLSATATPPSTTATSPSTRATTPPSTSTAAVRARQVVTPIDVVWNGQLVTVTPMVSAEKPTAQENLAALVTGSVDVDGRPVLRVMRADTPTPSPGTARALLEAAARTYTQTLDGDADLGELQPVPVAGDIVWVLPFYEAAGTRLSGVAALADGQVKVSRTVEGAVQALFKVDPGFITRQPGGTPETSSVPSGKTADELLAQAEELSRQATARLKDGQPTEAINLLRQAYERAAEAARRRSTEGSTGGSTTTTTTVPPTTTTTAPTVNA